MVHNTIKKYAKLQIILLPTFDQHR